MKFELRRSKSASATIVEVSEEVASRHPALGDKFELGVAGAQQHESLLLADGRSIKIGNRIIRLSSKPVQRKAGQYRVELSREGRHLLPYIINAKVLRPVEPKKGACAQGGGDLKSPMAGKVLSILASEGQKVEEGATLVIIEAMKMENRILAECDGHVKNIKIEPGKTVAAGDFLLTLIPAEKA